MFAARSAIESTLGDFPLPPGYKWSFHQSRWERREDEDNKLGLLLAAGLIYMVMAALFESFVHPFVIMFSIPFAFTGVALGYHITGNEINFLTHVGLLLLCGLVVNNAIVLIDHINHLRREGLDRRTALIKGGGDRLRPILMTTLTTILGLLPMVMPLLIPPITGLIQWTEWELLVEHYTKAIKWAGEVLPSVFGPIEGRDRMYAPMCLALVSGLTTSTILTLIVMPTMYSLIDDVGQWIRKCFSAA